MIAERRNIMSCTKTGHIFLQKILDLGSTFRSPKCIIIIGLQKVRCLLLSPRTGRPKTENPKSNPIHVRLDDESKIILERYCEQEKIAKTEGIRRGIKKLKSDIKE